MTDRTFIDSCIRAINDYRSVHQVAALRHNAVMSTVAQSWADKMARTGSFGHNPSATYNGERLGENCACKSSSDRRDFTGPEVAESWYSEVKNYDFKRNSGPSTGHFTQLVWKSSREIGLGRSQSRDGTWYVVANFFPAGNFIGRNAENVLPPRDGKIPASSSPAPTAAATARRDERPATGPSRGAAVPSAGSSRDWGISSVVTPLRPTAGSDYGTVPQYERDQSTGSGRGGDTLIQRRQQTRTVNGVTTTIITETTRDKDGNVKTTTTETVTSRDDDVNNNSSASRDPLSSRLASLGVGAGGGAAWSRGRDVSPAAGKVVVVREQTSSSPAQRSPQLFRVPVAAEVRTPVAAAGGSRAQQTDREFASQVVQQHNIYRRQHGNVGDLTLNGDLSKMAQSWAARLASMNRLQHSDTKYRGEPTGENIAYKFSSLKEGYTGEEVVKQWYSEVTKCNFKQPEAAVSGAGHFSQVVWKGSREIGVGRAFADGGQTVYVVCNYYPPGNVVGRFKENIFPTK